MYRWKRWGVPLYWLCALLLWELLSHGAMYGEYSAGFRFALGFGAAIALALTTLVWLLPERAAFPVSLILTLLLIFLYGSQMVYCFIFGTPYSVSQMGMGADAVGAFWRETLSAVEENFLWLLGLFVPAAGLVLLHRMDALGRPKGVWRIVPLLLAGNIGLATYVSIFRGGVELYSDYYYLTDENSTTTQCVERFGVPVTFWLELSSPAQEEVPEDAEPELTEIPPEVLPEVPAATEAVRETEAAPEETAPEAEVPTGANVLDLDFDAMNAAGKFLSLNAYVAGREPTSKNRYTGMLRDYNLIYICAESFSPAAVHPEVTPTLYKLANEGFVFHNYFNSFPNTTIDGEYAMTQGMYPNAKRGKKDSSMLASAGNLLPFTLGNLFAQQRGIQSWGYHNNVGSYYSREISHPNMGYTMQFNHAGMEMTNDWPASDLEMMEQTVDDYIHESQFHAYYMTFSGHHKYDVELNSLAAKNYDLVKDLPGLTSQQKCYLSCNIELDRALEYLLKRLDEEGVLDRTAIVMAGDHFPYGLPKEQYYDMMGMKADHFEKFRSNLIFWVGGMEEPVDVDAYCCNVDILPTVLNLWGFDFDSRLLAGTDILSDGLHVAVFTDHTFLTEVLWHNPNARITNYLVEESQVPEKYIQDMNRILEARFAYSTTVLERDYFRFVMKYGLPDRAEGTN